jgi:capsular polysaccharide transport system permease protein
MPSPGDDIDAIRREGLTGRQLRMARRLAQKHNLPATSDFDAVRLLRQAGIDPFQANSALEVVSGGDLPNGASQSRERALSGGVKLPQTLKSAGLPSVEDRAAEAHIAEVSRIQRDIVRRRRAKTIQLIARMGVFVGLPTLLAGIYFYSIATPFYSTKTEFVIQQAEAAGGDDSGGAGDDSGGDDINPGVGDGSTPLAELLASPSAAARASG